MTTAITQVGYRISVDASGAREGGKAVEAALDAGAAAAGRLGQQGTGALSALDAAAARLPGTVAPATAALDSAAAAAQQLGLQGAAAVSAAAAEAAKVPTAVAPTKAALDDAAAAATRFGAQGAAALEEAGTAAAALPTTLAPATAALEGAGTSAERLGKRAESALAATAGEAAKLPGALGPARTALDGTAAAAERLEKQGTAALKATAAQAAALPAAVAPAADAVASLGRKTEISAGQMQAAMRMLPAQMTDIFVGLSTGQSPFMVLAQQGGQLKDMFGGVGAAARAVGGYVLNMVNPLTIAAAAAAALGAAYLSGSAEVREFERTLVLSGNAVGKTSGQLQDMAARIGDVVGTQGAASAALLEMASSGNVAGHNLERFTEVAIRWEKVVGQAVGTTVEQFASLADKPVQASLKLNERYHYLTLAVYEQIRALEEQGRREEAVDLAQATLATAFDTRAKQLAGSVGIMERAWRGVKGAAAEAWDAMLGIGRGQTVQGQLAEVTKQIADREANAWKFGAGPDPAMEKLRGRQSALQEMQRLEQRGAALTAERASQAQRKAEWDAEGDKYASNAEKREKAVAAARLKANQLLRDGSITQAEADQRVKDIQEKLKDPKGTNTGRVDARAQTLLDIEGIKAAAAAELDANANSTRLLEANRAATLLSEQTYFARRRELVEQGTAIQVKALEAENERLQQDKLNTKDSLDRDRQVLANKAQIAKLQAEGKTQTAVIDIQAQATLDKPMRELLQARLKDVDAVSAQVATQDAANATFGKGKVALEELNLAQMRKLRADLEATDNVIPGYIAALDLQIAAQERLVAATKKGDQLEKADAARKKEKEAIERTADDIQSIFRKSVVDAFNGGDNVFQAFGKSLKSTVVTAIADAFYDATLKDTIKQFSNELSTTLKNAFKGGNSSGGSEGVSLSKIVGGIAGIFGGMSGASAAATANVVGGDDKLGSMLNLMGLTKSAKGNVFAGATGLHAYANTVVDRPTVFPFAKGVGLMGEAGPEGILPLRRDSQGRLGVMAGGGGGAGGNQITYAPVNHFYMDSRVDRGAAIADTQMMIAQNNRQQAEDLQRMKVLPTS